MEKKLTILEKMSQIYVKNNHRFPPKKGHKSAQKILKFTRGKKGHIFTRKKLTNYIYIYVDVYAQ